MGDKYQKLLWAKLARARRSREQLRRMNRRIVPIRPHSGIASRHLLSPSHALPPGQTIPSPERPSSLTATTPEVPRFGPKQQPPFLWIANPPPPPARGAAGAGGRESRAALGSAALWTRSAPARHRGSSGQPWRPRPPRRPCNPRRDRRASDAAVCPPGEGRGLPPCPARPAPRALLPARERSSPRSSAGPMLAVSGSERGGCGSHAARPRLGAAEPGPLRRGASSERRPRPDPARVRGPPVAPAAGGGPGGRRAGGRWGAGRGSSSGRCPQGDREAAAPGAGQCRDPSKGAFWKGLRKGFVYWSIAYFSTESRAVTAHPRGPIWVKDSKFPT